MHISDWSSDVCSSDLGGPTHLLAWNPVTQTEAWRVPADRAGVLATAGGLVFQGQGAVTGRFTAFRADNGREVWNYKMPNGVQAAPIAYSVRGVQYEIGRAHV